MDDGLNSGTPDFELLTESTSQVFECKKWKYDNFSFFGTRISTVEESVFLLNQKHYCAALRKVPLKPTMDDLGRSRAFLAWTTHTRPELGCLVDKMEQVMTKSLQERLIKTLNNGIRRALTDTSRGRRYAPLNENKVHMRVYTDASFATNDDLTSQLGYLVLVCDDNHRCHVLNFASKKSQTVTCTVIGGELYAFTDAFDISYTLLMDVRNALGREVMLHMFTDSKQVFDVVTSGKRPT